MREAPFTARWRSLEDLSAFLKEYIRNRGDGPIREEEDLIKAHRRASEVALAQRIIATIERRYDNDDEEE